MPVPDSPPDEPLDLEDEEPDESLEPEDSLELDELEEELDELEEELDELEEELDDEDDELAELPSMKLWGTERNFSLKKPEYPGSASVRNGSAA